VIYDNDWDILKGEFKIFKSIL